MFQAGGISTKVLRQKRVRCIQGTASFSVFSVKHQASVDAKSKREESVRGLWEVPRIGKFKETESRIEVTRGCGQD